MTKSLNELAIKLGSKVALGKALHKQIDRIRDAESALIELTHEAYEQCGHHPAYMALGYNDCDISPFTICAYNLVDDPAHDNCVFCHEPHERK